MMEGCRDFVCMVTVLLRLRLSPSHAALLMTLQHDGEAMEVWEIVKMSGVSGSVAYRGLIYLRKKGLVLRRNRKDFYRQTVRTWELTDEGRRVTCRIDGLYRRVVQEWRRRWDVRNGGRL